MSAIPNPLRSGTYTLGPNDSYTGDVGSLPGTPDADIAEIDLAGNAGASVTVEGVGDPFGQPASSIHTARFRTLDNTSNSLALNTVGGGIHSGYGPGRAAITLGSGSTLHGGFTVASDGIVVAARSW